MEAVWLTPILPVSERLRGMCFVCSMVELMSSSKSEILTDCDRACESESLVLLVKARRYSQQSRLTCRTTLCAG